MSHDIVFAAFLLLLAGISTCGVVALLNREPVIDCPEPDLGRLVVCIDFDGVLHSFTSGWCGIDVIPDPPIEDAFRWLERLLGHDMIVCIFGYRSRSRAGREAMRKWLLDRGCPQGVVAQLHFPSHKPAAHITIDDRTYRFEGTHFPGPRWLAAFRPWWERVEGEDRKNSRHGVLDGISGCHKCGNDAVEFGWYDTGDRLARQRAHYYCRKCGQSHSGATPAEAKAMWNEAQKREEV